MRITKTVSLAILLLIVISAGAFAMPDRLVIEVDDPVALDLRSKSLDVSNLRGFESLDIGLEPIFYEPQDAERRQIWYDLGMNRWFRITGQDKSIDLLINNSVIGRSILSTDVIVADKKHIIPNDHENYDMWGLDRMNLPAAWDINYQDIPSSVKISTIDTGTKISHPDLAGNIYVNPGEDLNGNGIWDPSDIDGVDTDNNGFIDDISGWDFVSYIPTDPEMAIGEEYGPPDNEVFPDINGHGTHVAGTAAAVSNNGIGVSAASWNITSMPLKAGFAWINPDDGQEYGLGYGDDFAAAIQYAVDNGSRVISISFGGTGYYEPYAAAVAYARMNNVLLFASAGNEAYSTLTYPAAYEGAIAVAATQPGDAKAGFSNFGEWIDICAPGTGIWSTMSNSTYSPGDYANYQGTSMACPNAASVAAFILSYDPMLSGDDLEMLIYDTADDIYPVNPSYPGQLGHGLVNAYAALDFLSSGPETAVFIPDGTFGIGQFPVVYSNGFDDVAGVELHIAFDSNVYQVNNVILNGAIDDATVNIEPGMVHIVWAGVTAPLNLDDGAVLASLQGHIIGAGGETFFGFAPGTILSDLVGEEYPCLFEGGFWEGYGEVAQIYIPDGMFIEGMPQLYANGLENVAGIELHINYNSQIFEVLNITLHPALEDAVVNVMDGVIHIIWAGIPETLTLPDETLLATFEGIVLGNGNSFFGFDPNSILSDEFGNPYPVHFTGGNWEGSGGGAIVSIPSGNFDTGMVPEIIVDGIMNVAGIEFHVEYDDSVFDILEVALHPSIGDAIVNVMDGIVHIIWAGVPNTVTFPHHTVLASLIGIVVDEGGSTPFTFTPNSVMSNAIGEEFPAHYIGGNWFGTGSGDYAFVRIPDGSFDSELIPRVEVDGFEGVAGVELHIDYDDEVYEILNVVLHPEIADAIVNVMDGMIHIIWAGIPNTVTLPDGAELASFEGVVLDDSSPTFFEFMENSILADESGEHYPAIFIGGYWTDGAGLNHPPFPFNMLTPEDEEFFDTFDIPLTWEDNGDPNGSAVSYDIFVADAPIDVDNPGTPVNAAPIADPQFTFQAAGNGNYFWRVVALDGDGGVRWANQADWEFDVEVLNPPDPFNLLLPADESEVTFTEENFEIEFSWEQSHDPDPGDVVHYDAYLHVVSVDPEFDVIYHLPGLTDTSYAVNIPDSLYGEVTPIWLVPIEVDWWIHAISNDDTTECNDHFSLTLMEHTSGVDDPLHGAIPTEYSIESVYPNPFNPSINVVVAVPQTGRLQIEVIDIMGRHVDTIFDNVTSAGHHSYNWTARGPSGIYFLRASSESGWQQVSKIMFIK
jgi:subtilisin family serine protease